MGAYVVSKLIKAEMTLLKNQEPAFSYTDEGVSHTVSVGGTIHGDFIMTETTVMQSDIRSPIHTSTEFGPKSSLTVGGYHSVEPEIVASIIEAVYLESGEEAAKQLVDEFIEISADKKSTSDPRETNETPFYVPAFADYGDGDVRYSLTSLRILVTDKDYAALKRNKYLHSSLYLPQSSLLFEILPVKDGIKFQNRQKDFSDYSDGIFVSRDRYTSLFHVLLRQTSRGLGRTSPAQIIQLVHEAKKILSHKAEI
ncbi:MAG: hypothetical protein NVSMB46_03480 [Candidatus Saccharimonadales bacterium]